MKVKSQSVVAQFCPTLRDPMDCSLPGFSVHGIFQARVLEWGAIDTSNKPYNFVSLFVISKYNDLLLKATYLNMKKEKYLNILSYALIYAYFLTSLHMFFIHLLLDYIFSNCFLRVLCILRKSALDLPHVSSHLLVGSCLWCITQMI